MSDEYLDEDGYPTQLALEKIANWHDSPDELLEFTKNIWWMKSMLWHEKEKPHHWKQDKMLRVFSVSTGGWSGNEDIIRAMQKSDLWSWIWYQSRRGGHYVFEIE